MEFALKDLSITKQILGMRIVRDNDFLKVSYEEHMKKVLSRFSINDTK